MKQVKGHPQTQATRDKISATLKGRPTWNKGKKLPEGWMNEERRKKISAALMGRKVFVSAETRKRMSAAKKGKAPKNLAYLHSLPYTEERKRKIGIAHKGMKHTEETKKRISEIKRDPLRPIYRAVRECFKYREWHRFILKRDNYTCQFCGKNGELHVDHIKKFSTILKENKITSTEEAINCLELWDVNNGRTLCVPCHKNTDTWGNNKRNMI